ncbi:MAG: hypothetical protein U5R06_02400 [candidate division KSB1 bacterium]|nr:hypothetical protein [candidate division KSB1 bacterium]
MLSHPFYKPVVPAVREIPRLPGCSAELPDNIISDIKYISKTCKNAQTGLCDGEGYDDCLGRLHEAEDLCAALLDRAVGLIGCFNDSRYVAEYLITAVDKKVPPEIIKFTNEFSAIDENGDQIE